MNTDRIFEVDTSFADRYRADMKRGREFTDAGIATAESTAAMHAEMKNTARDAGKALFWAKIAGWCGGAGVVLAAISAWPVISGWFSKA